MTRLTTYADRAALIRGVARRLETDLKTRLETSAGPVSFAAAGGSTPGPVYDLLAQADLDWSRVRVVPGDERWVDTASPRSNAGALAARFLQGPAAAAQLVPLFTGAPTPEDALAELGTSVARLMPLDVVFLGMGADMHTASLFPGARGLALAMRDDADAPVVAAIRSPEAGEPRVTLSVSALRSAPHVHIMITGREKRTALDMAARLPHGQAPVGALLDIAEIHWAE